MHKCVQKWPIITKKENIFSCQETSSGSLWRNDFMTCLFWNWTEIFTALMLAVYSTRHSCYPRAICATDFQASRLDYIFFSFYLLRAAHLGRVRPINNYILLQQRGGKLKFLLYFCSSQWCAVANNFNLARLLLTPPNPQLQSSYFTSEMESI